LRSAFVQFLATSSENKEYCLGIRPDQCVRDSDHLRSVGDGRLAGTKRAGTGLMPKKKASSIPPKLTEAEQDLLAHVEHGYELETDSLGGNPILRRLKDGEVSDLSPRIGTQSKRWRSAASFTQEKVVIL
jgi:hypothetical protein